MWSRRMKPLLKAINRNTWKCQWPCSCNENEIDGWQRAFDGEVVRAVWRRGAGSSLLLRRFGPRAASAEGAVSTLSRGGGIAGCGAGIGPGRTGGFGVGIAGYGGGE